MMFLSFAFLVVSPGSVFASAFESRTITFQQSYQNPQHVVSVAFVDAITFLLHYDKQISSTATGELSVRPESRKLSVIIRVGDNEFQGSGSRNNLDQLSFELSAGRLITSAEIQAALSSDSLNLSEQRLVWSESVDQSTQFSSKNFEQPSKIVLDFTATYTFELRLTVNNQPITLKDSVNANGHPTLQLDIESATDANTAYYVLMFLAGAAVGAVGLWGFQHAVLPKLSKVPSTQRKCSKCGSNVKAGARFCGKCGSQVP